MEFNKNTIIGLVLMLALAFGVSWYNAKQAQEDALKKSIEPVESAQANNTPTSQDTPANNVTPAENPIARIDSTELIEKKGVFGEFTQGESAIYTLENKQIKIRINGQGATLHSAEIKSDEYLIS